MADTIEVYKDDAGKFRWRRQAANGEIVADSGQGYDRTGIIRAVQRQTPAQDVNVTWPDDFWPADDPA